MDANPTPHPVDRHPLDDTSTPDANTSFTGGPEPLNEVERMKILDRLFGGRDKPKGWTKWRRLRPTARRGHRTPALYRRAGGGEAWAAYRRRQQDHLDAGRQADHMDAAGMLPPMNKQQRDAFVQQHAANITTARGGW